MSDKENSNSQQNKRSSLGSEKSQKTKQSAARDLTNNNVKINSSIIEIKKGDTILKKVEFPDQGRTSLDYQLQVASLHKQKAQAFKELKKIDKEQIQAEVMLRKSQNKLSSIRHSSSGKQNKVAEMGKNQSAIIHKSNQITRYKSRNPHAITQPNYSLVNGKKVYMSEEDVAKLKKLKIQYKMRENKIKKKVQAHQQLIEKMKTEQIQSKDQKIEQKIQTRLKSIQQRQKITSKERQQRLERYQEENRRLKQIKQSKKLFEKLEEQFQTIQEKQKQNLNQMIKSRLGQGTVNFDQIKQHEKQYIERNKQNIENSRLRVKSKMKQMEEEFNNLNLHKSQFYERVKHEKKEMLKEMEQNQMRKKVCSQKIKEYREVVRQNFMPNISRVQMQPQTKKPQYNIQQIHTIGNEYMKQGVKLIDRQKSLDLREKMRKQETQNSQKNTYKNYLREDRADTSTAKPKSKTQKQELLMERELKKINTITNPQERYEKIKLLHNRIQKDLQSSMQIGGRIKLKTGKAERSDHENSEDDVKRIRAKLQLLESL